MANPIVLIAEELSPATISALGPDFEIRKCDGTNREELFKHLENADAILIRSATKLDAEALGYAKNLKVIARAGVGKMTIVDGDVVDTTNRNRQLVALATNHGVSKAQIMKQRLLEINPDLELTFNDDFIIIPRVKIMNEHCIVCQYFYKYFIMNRT